MSLKIGLTFCKEVLLGPPPQRGGKQAGHDHLAELKKQRLEFEETEAVGDRISEGTCTKLQKLAWGPLSPWLNIQLLKCG